MIKVIIADDHPFIAEGVERNLTSMGIEIASKVTELKLLDKEVKRVSPDVVILDISFSNEKMSGLDYLELWSKGKVGTRKEKYILFSQHNDISIIKEGFKLDAKAVISKDTPTTQLADAVKVVARGDTWLPRETVQALVSDEQHKPNKSESGKIDSLSERELRVFTLYAQGKITKEICEILPDVGLRTIQNDMVRIKEKLGLLKQADFVRLAMREGILK